MPANGYTSKVRVLDKYKVVGFISSGTYGRVYKAIGLNGQGGEFAIKKSASSSQLSARNDPDSTIDSSQIRRAR